MEKNLREDEIKELEEEIDSAVDRLFVEKRTGLSESSFQEPVPLSPSPETSRVAPSSFDFEPGPNPTPASSGPLPQPPSYLKSIDHLEAQLLSLEWEITDEKLRKTQEAVKHLDESINQKAEVGSVLGYMASVLEQMVAGEQNIQPPMIKFLLDAKETVKLLVREEAENEFTIYKQLAREGIEARFTGLRKQNIPLTQAAPSVREEPVTERPVFDWKRAEEVLAQWNGFLLKAEGVLCQIDQRLSLIEKVHGESLAPLGKAKLPQMDITVFKACGKLYGVESQKVMKLYKIPTSFEEKYTHRQKLRLRDMDVTLIDLKKTFQMESWHPEVTPKLLLTQEEGECKGLIVEEILKRLTISPEDRTEDGKPLLGTTHWTYQAHPVEVLILDLKRL